MTRSGINTGRNRDPLHSVTLEMILARLVDYYGWERMGRMIAINCFNKDPGIKSSLKFLRRTPWARKKVETLYLRTVFPGAADKRRRENGTDRPDK